LASYAKQTDDDTLRRLADAFRRRGIGLRVTSCARDSRRVEAASSRAKAARDAGLSRDENRTALRATPFDPPMPARADAVKMVAARLGAVAVEVDANRAAPAAPPARPAMAVRREVGLLDGRGRHPAPLPLDGYAVARKRLSVLELFEASWLAPP